MLTFIAHRDHKLMRRINRWYAPRWIRLWMICATRGGDGWLWYAMGAIVLLFGGPQRFLAVASGALAAGSGIALFLRPAFPRWSISTMRTPLQRYSRGECRLQNH